MKTLLISALLMVSAIFLPPSTTYAFDQSLSNRLSKDASRASCRGKQCAISIIDRITTKLRGKPDYRVLVTSLKKVRRQISRYCSRGCNARQKTTEKAKLRTSVGAERAKIRNHRRREIKTFGSVYLTLLAKL